jgi:hypothetical protein
MSKDPTLSRRDVLKTVAIAGVAPSVLPGAFKVLDADARATLVAPLRFRVDPFWPKPLPRDPATGRYWVTGEVAGTAFDSRDRLYTVNRRNLIDTEQRNAAPSPAFVVYDLAGNVVHSATPPVLPDGLHGCFVDHQDNVWIAGNADAIVQKYSHDLRTLLLQIGEKGRFDSSDGTITGTPTNSSRTLLNRPADVAVDPDKGMSTSPTGTATAGSSYSTGPAATCASGASRRPWPKPRPGSVESSCRSSTASTSATTGWSTSTTGRATGSRSSTRTAPSDATSGSSGATA